MTKRALFISLMKEWQCDECPYCQLPLKAPTIDHFLPIFLPDAHVLSNLLIVCNRCNSLKRNYVFDTITSVQHFIYDHNLRTRPSARWWRPIEVPILQPGLSAHSQMAEILFCPLPNLGLLAESDYPKISIYGYGRTRFDKILGLC